MFSINSIQLIFTDKHFGVFRSEGKIDNDDNISNRNLKTSEIFGKNHINNN